MSHARRIAIQIPSAATTSDFCASHKLQSDLAIIAVGYSLVLYRLLDITSYLYGLSTPDRGLQGEARSEQSWRCLEIEPESTLKETLESTTRCLGPLYIDIAEQPAANYLALSHPEASEHHAGDAKYTIGLVITKEDKRQDGENASRSAVLEFNVAMFNDFQAHNFARTFIKGLHVIVTGGIGCALSSRVLEVDLLSVQDLDMVSEGNTQDLFASQQCIPDLVEETCAQYIDQTAVISSSDGTSLTYSRLNKLADRLGFHLVRKYDLGRGVIIPLCLDKSTFAVVVMLGVLKTGAAYCCLDPQHPRARHDFIIESVKAPVVLASPQHGKLFSCPVLALDSTFVQQLELQDEDEHIEFNTRRLEDTCVVVFSSGSTGVPKGIVHTHQTLATGLIQNGPRHDLNHPGIRVFQWCAFTFDISLTEIWGTLICGGVICIPSEEERLNDVEVPMNQMGVEWAFFTPSFARFFCRQQYCVETLRTLVVGGEALTQQDAHAFLKSMDLEKVIHLFGPAELITQFLKTLTPRTVNGPERRRAENVPFCPSYAHCWIVEPDSTNRLAPVGAVGELLIEAPALFTGYLNDKARNDIAFVPSPPSMWRKSCSVLFYR